MLVAVPAPAGAVGCVTHDGHLQLEDHGRASGGGVVDREVAAHRPGEPPGHREPEADPGAVRRAVVHALERLEDPLALGGGDARAAVDHADQHAAGDLARLDPHRAPRRASGPRRSRPGWRRPARAARGRPPRVAAISGTSTVTCAAAVAEAGDRRGHDLLEADGPQGGGDGAGLDAAHVEQVDHQRGQPVGLVLDGGEELVAVLVRPVDVGLAEAAGRRLDPRQRRAQVVRHRLQQRAAQLVGLGQRRGPGRLGADAAAVDRRRELGDEGVEHPAVLGRQVAAPHGQHEVAAEGAHLVGLGRGRGGVAGRRLGLPGAVDLAEQRRRRQAEGVLQVVDEHRAAGRATAIVPARLASVDGLGRGPGGLGRAAARRRRRAR